MTIAFDPQTLLALAAVINAISALVWSVRRSPRQSD